MKNRLLIIMLTVLFIAECVTLLIFVGNKGIPPLDTVAVNEICRTVEDDFYSLDNHKVDTKLSYTVFDKNGNILYKTGDRLSKSLNEAVASRDTILNIAIDGEYVGYLVIDNNSAHAVEEYKSFIASAMLVLMAAQLAVCIIYIVYLNIIIIRPFKKLEGFAERVAAGNLDIPLEMDRQNAFGAFTESFDIMRSELKKARQGEADANRSKKELVAKLSHDIKTPVASIKAVSEVGLATADTEKQKASYKSLIGKADQINTLVTNLFSATLEELQKLDVTPEDTESTLLYDILKNADYLCKAKIPEIPPCIIYADRLRLQQVFDNIFSNSYKYANTGIDVAVTRYDNSISVEICDNGGGVSDDDIALIKEKFYRGKNAGKADGAGLGLFISDYFMKKMNGALTVQNKDGGLCVTVTLKA